MDTTRRPRRRLSSLTFAALAPLLFGSSAIAAPLTPEEAIKRAAARSPELSVALAELESASAGVRIEALARTPILIANASGSYAESFSDTSEGATRNSNERVAADIGLETSTTIGTRISAGFSTSSRWQTVNRDPTTTSGVTLGPTIAAELTFDVTQPLLRGAGESAVLSGLRIARTQQRQAELEKNLQTSQLGLTVLSAYWDLWVAERALEVERAGFELSSRQKADVETRVRLGASPETDLLRLSSEAASRRQRVVDAEVEVADRQLALSRLIGLSYAESAQLTTAATPVGRPLIAELEATLDAARTSSPELLSLELAEEQARERLRAARDAASTRLDAWANLAAGGLWTEGPPTGLSLPGDRPALSAMVGLTLELPLGDAANDARVDQAAASLRGTSARKQAREETLELEVARLHRSLQAARDAVATAAETASIAKRLAEREEARIKLGTAVILDLITAQQSQRESELAKLRAEAQAERLALQLDHLTGTLLGRVALESKP